jgi:copper chaperone
MDSKTVSVPNISCGHCVKTIEREVGDLAGVVGVRADRETRRVTISWDPEATDWVAIEEHLTEIHYPPTA